MRLSWLIIFFGLTASPSSSLCSSDSSSFDEQLKNIRDAAIKDSRQAQSLNQQSNQVIGSSQPASSLDCRPLLLPNTAKTLDDQLLLAVSQDRLEEVRKLIDLGAHSNARNRWGTALMMACELGYPPMVQFLLEKGADPNGKDRWQSTPLETAAKRGYPEIVKLLLEYGADPKAEDLNGDTALDIAKRQGFKKIVTLLRTPLKKKP